VNPLRAGERYNPRSRVEEEAGMSEVSRRGFISSLTVGGTAAGLASAAGTAAATEATDPVTHHHWVELKPTSRPVKIMLAARADHRPDLLSAAELARIRGAAPDVDLVVPKSDAEQLKAAGHIEAILGEPSVEIIRAAKGLRWVQHWAAGVEKLPPELMAHPCVLTNMARVFAPVIAESAFAMLLALTRGLVADSFPNFQKRSWPAPARTSVPLVDLYQKTMGVVGLGGLGTEISRRAVHGFGMKVLAIDAKPMPKPEWIAELREPGWLKEMVPQVDVLVNCAPLTRQTDKMFGSAVFRAMKKSAYFISVSRGGLVDQQALALALRQGTIQGAGLDVTTPEPLPGDDPLWACPNLIITPHNSGVAPIRQVRLVALVAENVRRYASGLPLLNVVDKQRGY
jgi:phosphoglycerate dehydrogenase-like enzyme